MDALRTFCQYKNFIKYLIIVQLKLFVIDQTRCGSWLHGPSPLERGLGVRFQ